MGNCLKKNKVAPLVVKDNADEILARGTPRQGEEKDQQADMIKSLKQEVDHEAQVAGGGVSFNVDFKPGKKSKKPPKLGKKTSSGTTAKAIDPDLPQYSLEEKALMADILREEQLKERTEKARKTDIKIYDAKRRRMCHEAEAKALADAQKKESQLEGLVRNSNSDSKGRVASPGH